MKSIFIPVLAFFTESFAVFQGRKIVSENIFHLSLLPVKVVIIEDAIDLLSLLENMGDSKPSIKSNTAVIESLNNLHDYASQYKERLGQKDEEQKKKEDEQIQKYLQRNKNMSIQEQIAETLRQAKIKEEAKKNEEQKKKKDKELAEMIVTHYMTLYHQKCRKRLRDFFLCKIFLWVLYDNIGTLVCPEHPHVTMVFQKHFKKL